jgi:hypothetical protein
VSDIYLIITEQDNLPSDFIINHKYNLYYDPNWQEQDTTPTYPMLSIWDHGIEKQI